MLPLLLCYSIAIYEHLFYCYPCLWYSNYIKRFLECFQAILYVSKISIQASTIKMDERNPVLWCTNLHFCHIITNVCSNFKIIFIWVDILLTIKTMIVCITLCFHLYMNMYPHISFYMLVHPPQCSSVIIFSLPWPDGLWCHSGYRWNICSSVNNVFLN